MPEEHKKVIRAHLEGNPFFWVLQMQMGYWAASMNIASSLMKGR